MSKIRAKNQTNKAKALFEDGNYEDAARICVSAIRAAKKSKSFAMAGKAFQIIESIPYSSSVVGGLKKEAAHLIFEGAE